MGWGKALLGPLVGAALLLLVVGFGKGVPGPWTRVIPPRVEPTPIPVPTPNPFRTVRGTVTDLYTSSPIVSATVSIGDRSVWTDEQGGFELQEVRAGATIVASAAEHEPARATVAAEGSPELKLRPTSLSGKVVDAVTGAPLAGARVYLGSVITQTDDLGQFRLVDVPPDPTITVKQAGYAKAQVQPGRVVSREVRLQPFAVKGAYLTYYLMGLDERRDRVFDLIDRTELNAVVIDVKGDRGWLVYDTEVPLARAMGAAKPMVKDFDKLMARLKERHIYTIARIVVFKDDVLAQKRPDLAVHTSTGEPYVDWENLHWVDPFQREVWEYNIALAEEAARKGFDEIQFDYVRFPSEAAAGAVYSQESSQPGRVEAINSFVAAANARLQRLGVFTAVDLFGWSMLRDDDLGIGQRIEGLAPHVDYICPMVYPSAWMAGSADVADPVAQPYDIVYRSLKSGVERLQDEPTVRIRAWLQDFNDYGPRKVPYGAQEVRLQKKAAADAGATGWMLWDPEAKYTEQALDKEQ